MQETYFEIRGSHFEVRESFEEHPNNDRFFLHEHRGYEIMLFLKGDSQYIIEGQNYFLESGDIIIIRKHEMHRIYHNSSSPYHRIVLMIWPDFFPAHHCEAYETPFSRSQMGLSNRIKSGYARSCGLSDAFMRLKKYSGDFTISDEPIVEAAVLEILYLINQIGRFSHSDKRDPHIEQVISYINTHFTESISLEALEDTFFISRYYLCKIFRKATGLTIHDYICRKRLSMVHELHRSGESIQNAAMAAGFNDYSSFYRAHRKIAGCSPRKGLDNPSPIE